MNKEVYFFLNKYSTVFILMLLLQLNNAEAQNVTSPYSILGIGDIDTKDFGRFFSSGNASIARRNSNAYNFSNPASLTSLPFKLVNFDITSRGKLSTYTYPKADTSLGIPSNDLVVKRISFAFKPTEKTAIAFGLKPYSSVNYLYFQDNVFLDGNTSYFKLIDGNGGINQVYFSIGKEVAKRLSIGVTTSWLFGSIQRQTQYLNQIIALNVTKKETDFYTGALLQGGLQYYSAPGKKWIHQFGLTTSISSGLKGELTTDYFDGPPTMPAKSTTEKGRNFKLPITIGVGYTVVKKDKLHLSFDWLYSSWKYQKVNYTNSYTNPSMRFSTGIEYSFKHNKSNTSIEKSFISAGFSIENSYINIQKNKLLDASFSIGAGKNISRNISVFSGLEIGQRGSQQLNQIKENYTQYIFGLTLKDIWIGPKYSRKYD